MHKINLNEVFEMPEKKTPNHLKEKLQIPQKTAGFNPKPKSPLKSLKSFEITKNFEEKPLKKSEIYENLLNMKENLKETQRFPHKKPELYEDLIEDLENNVEKIRYKRQKLLENSQKYDKIDENPNEFETYAEISKEKYDKSYIYDNFYQENPSLQNIGNIVENQRKNLKEIESLYNLKKSQKMANFDVNNLSNYKQKHEELSNKFRRVFSAKNTSRINDKLGENSDNSSTLVLKVKENPLLSPSFGRNRENTEGKSEIFSQKSRKISPFGEKFERFHEEKQLKNRSEVFFKGLEKSQFDNWRSEANYLKKPHVSLQKPQEIPFTDLPITKKNLNFNENINENHDISSENIAKKELNSLLKEKISLKSHEKREKDSLLSFLFQQIDRNSLKIASKQEIFDYLSQNPKVLLAFDLEKTWLFQSLESFKTQRIGLLSEIEFQAFIHTCKENEKNQKKTQEKIQLKPVNSENKHIEINEELLEKMRKILIQEFPHFFTKRLLGFL